jgi:dienelactone hydrolase
MEYATMSNSQSSATRRSFIAQSALASVALAHLSPNTGNAKDNIMATEAPDAIEQMRQHLVECLGGPWPEPCPLNPIVKEIQNRDGFRIESLTYEVESGDRVPALLLIPDHVSKESPAPAIAIWHQHNGEWHLGKSEPAGLAGNPMHHTGVALAREGYVVLCPDALCFEERRDPENKLQDGNFERFEFLRYVVQGKSMAWKNILDMQRAIDFLQTREEVQGERIGCYGHSMGSTHCWLIGPHEPRIKAIVGNCCLPTYDAIHATKMLHCFPNYVPGWQRFGDTPEMAALIAPRALHLNLGETDSGSPIEFAKAGIARIEEAYRKQGAANQFTYFIEPDTGHVLSETMWAKTRDFFKKHL